MLKYMTRWGQFADTKITLVECERESETSVWVNGRRNQKRTTYENYWDTWDQAHAFLLLKAEALAQSCRRELEVANGHLGNVRGMKPPV